MASEGSPVPGPAAHCYCSWCAKRPGCLLDRAALESIRFPARRRKRIYLDQTTRPTSPCRQQNRRGSPPDIPPLGINPNFMEFRILPAMSPVGSGEHHINRPPVTLDHFVMVRIHARQIPQPQRLTKAFLKNRRRLYIAPLHFSNLF
jgi:hypothetical protein